MVWWEILTIVSVSVILFLMIISVLTDIITKIINYW